MTRAAIIGLLVLPVVLLGCGNPLTPYPLDYVPPDPCHLVSSAEVGEAAGFVVSEGTHDGALTCHWDGPVDKGGNPEYVELTIDPGDVHFNVIKGSDVPDLGLEANILPGSGQLNVRITKTAFNVFAQVPTTTQLAVEQAIATLVIPRAGG